MEESADFKKTPWGARQAITVFFWAWIGVPLGLILLLQQVSFVPVLHHFADSLRRSDLTASFELVIINAVAAVGFVAYYLYRYKLRWRDLGLRRFNIIRAVGYVVLAFILLYVLVGGAYKLIELIFPHFNSAQPQVNEFTKATTPQGRELSFIALVLIPPVIEEIVFRGFMFPALSRRFGVIFGAIATSIFFGIAHLQLNVSVYTIILSLLLCGLYLRLRSIWPGVVFHMLNNYLAFMSLMHK